MKPTRLILVPERATDPAPYRVFDASGVLLERGEITLETARPRPELRDVALVPGTDVLVRWLEPSPGNRAQQTAAALWRLREELAAPIDRLSAALGPVQADGQLVAVTAISLLEAWRDYFVALHLAPIALAPNSLAAPRPADPDSVFTAEVAGGVALRAQGLAAVVQPDLVEVLTAGRERVAADGAFEAALAGLALHPPLDLRGRLRRTERGRLRDWRLAVILAAALIVSPLAVEGIQATIWSMRADQARTQTRELAVEAWPELAAATDQAIAGRLSAALSPGDLSSGAAAMFAAVEIIPGAELDAFGVDPSQGLNAVVSYPAFQDLDQLRSALGASGFRVQDISTVEDGGRVVSDLRLERRR